MAEKSDDQGLLASHTPARAGRETVAEDPIAADLRRIDQARADAEAEQLDLLEGSPDLVNEDVLSMAANLVARGRRERGRPKGSPNRKNDEVFEYLESLGHRCPAVTLSMLQTASTTALAAALKADPVDVLKIQRQAAADLMPYKFSRKPQAIELPDGEQLRPMMVIGEMNVQIGNQGGAMSVSPRPMKTIDNQEDSEALPVRQGEAKSYDPVK